MSNTVDQSQKLTPLHAEHVAAGARIVPFAGWQMPVQYQGIKEEHRAVREGAGIFDVSHMGQIRTSGSDALQLLQLLLSNDVSQIPLGGAQYSVLCNPDGGVIDDLFTYRLGESDYLTVTNAANHDQDLAWFKQHANGFAQVEIEDRIDHYAMIALQGPAARKLLASITADELPQRMRAGHIDLAGIELLACGTGYTGEDGLELLVAPSDAVKLWRLLLAQGAVPVGLGARDTLRLEVCYHLYGNDLSNERGPIEAGLGWCCKEQTGFIGSEAVAAVRQSGPAESLVAFKMVDPGIARSGNKLVGGGFVTSGTMSPSLGEAIGMAYVPAQQAQVGQTLEIDVRGKVRRAQVVKKPFYSKEL